MYFQLNSADVNHTETEVGKRMVDIMRPSIDLPTAFAPSSRSLEDLMASTCAPASPSHMIPLRRTRAGHNKR